MLPFQDQLTRLVLTLINEVHGRRAQLGVTEDGLVRFLLVAPSVQHDSQLLIK